MKKERSESGNVPKCQSGEDRNCKISHKILNDNGLWCSCKSVDGKAHTDVRKLPADLQQVIDHWHTLPAEIKQTILTLVKHIR